MGLPLENLPDWPARMGEDLAAAFVGVSKTTFRERWQAKSYPQPVREGGRILWSRRQLERFVDAQFNLPQPSGPEPEDDTWADFK